MFDITFDCLNVVVACKHHSFDQPEMNNKIWMKILEFRDTKRNVECYHDPIAK